ncbi:hypothetical protein [Vibrio lentus]|uniref:hypothetical protein n=1 Tax=Vibrio lentus TaxID=136468 RepID=UPI000C843EF1|nr:hypothetical protein [Vibrio lentus]PMN12583.1 hypothetical protein BCT38_23280 [Vibrio lentus]
MSSEDTSNTITFTLEQLQSRAFHEASAKFNELLPSDICIGIGDELALADIEVLKEKGLLFWDLAFKLQPFMECISNSNHKILTVVYYGDGVIGRYCAGYALGSINEERKTIELNYIEKRADASEDLRCMFLPAIYEAWVSYAYTLIDLYGYDIERFVLVGPVPGVRRYYLESGFTEVLDFFGSEAMVRKL